MRRKTVLILTVTLPLLKNIFLVLNLHLAYGLTLVRYQRIVMTIDLKSVHFSRKLTSQFPDHGKFLTVVERVGHSIHPVDRVYIALELVDDCQDQ